MSGYIEKVLLNNVQIETNDLEKNSVNINDVIEIIEKNMPNRNFTKTLIDDFLENYLKIDNVSITNEQFIRGLQNNTIQIEIIKNFLNQKPSKEQIGQLMVKIILDTFDKNSYVNKGYVNYLDETINNFIKFHIINWNLSQDINHDESSLGYMERIYKIYYPTHKFNPKLLKNKISSRFFSDILKFHSLIKFNKIDTNEDIVKMFTDFLHDLYYDRDDGYGVKPFDFTKPFETANLDIYSLFLNTPLQVNLYDFLEEQREPDYKIRTDLILLEKLLKISKIFNLIGHKVIIVGSEFKTNSNNQGIWKNTPYKFDDIYEKILREYPKLPFNVINIYLEMDNECL
jgi:hypothetical protein